MRTSLPALSQIPKSYFQPRNRTKLGYYIRGLCVQCGKVPVKKYRWCVKCKIKYN